MICLPFKTIISLTNIIQKTSDNGFRLVFFAAAQNMVISSTRFQHLNIHKAIWRSADLNTKNQIDHVVIDGRHASSILDTTPVNHFSAVLMYRNCVHKRLPNRSPFAFRNSFTMLHQIPTSISSGNTLPTPYTLLLGKRLDIVDSRSQLGLTMNVARQQLRRTTHTRPH